jgi:hypothetical protein
MGNPMVGASVASGSEEAQRSFDSTCLKLHRFLSQPPALSPASYPQIPRTRQILYTEPSR